MQVYNSNKNLAYNLETFDVEETDTKKKTRPEMRWVPFSAARYGNWLVLLAVVACAVFAAAAMLSGKVTLNEIAVENSAVSSQLEEAMKENERLQSKLDALATPAKVEEYARDVLGLRKTDQSQINHISVNTEKIIEVAQTDDTDFFVMINNWFDSVLEYLGFE